MTTRRNRTFGSQFGTCFHWFTIVLPFYNLSTTKSNRLVLFRGKHLRSRQDLFCLTSLQPPTPSVLESTLSLPIVIVRIVILIHILIPMRSRLPIMPWSIFTSAAVGWWGWRSWWGSTPWLSCMPGRVRLRWVSMSSTRKFV